MLAQENEKKKRKEKFSLIYQESFTQP